MGGREHHGPGGVVLKEKPNGHLPAVKETPPLGVGRSWKMQTGAAPGSLWGSQSLAGWVPACHVYADTGWHLQAATCLVLSQRVQSHPHHWGLPHVLEFRMLSCVREKGRSPSLLWQTAPNPSPVLLLLS